MRVVAITGYSKTGKTALIETLTRELAREGKVGTVKHAHHELDVPGRDTHRHLQAGASITIALNPQGTVKLTNRPGDLNQALEELADNGVEYALVEGFKESPLPKIVMGDTEADNVLARLKSQEEIKTRLPELIRIIKSQPDSFHTLKSLILKIKSNPDLRYAGAIGTFTGIVREKTGDTTTLKLEYESHPTLAQAKLEEIRKDLKKREGIMEALFHHKTGVLLPGEEIVHIVVAAGHRHQLFPALEEALERLKAEVPIWKKEHTLNGEYWVTHNPLEKD